MQQVQLEMEDESIDVVNLGLELDSSDLGAHLAEKPTPAPASEPVGDPDLSLPLEGDEAVGSAVQDALATYVETCCTKRIAKDHLKSLRAKAKRPSNCPSAVAPQVNPPIWRDLKKYQRTRDVLMQSTQDLIVSGIHIATDMKECLMNKTGDDPMLQELSSKCSTLIALLGNASLETSYRRRDLLRSSINKKYHTLCAPMNPVGKLLFGDRMSDSLKEINEASKVSRGLTGTDRSTTTPYRHSGSNSRHHGSGSRAQSSQAQS